MPSNTLSYREEAKEDYGKEWVGVNVLACWDVIGLDIAPFGRHRVYIRQDPANGTLTRLT
jgi:hypothetical protein